MFTKLSVLGSEISQKAVDCGKLLKADVADIVDGASAIGSKVSARTRQVLGTLAMPVIMIGCGGDAFSAGPGVDVPDSGQDVAVDSATGGKGGSAGTGGTANEAGPGGAGGTGGKGGSGGIGGTSSEAGLGGTANEAGLGGTGGTSSEAGLGGTGGIIQDSGAEDVISNEAEAGPVCDPNAPDSVTVDAVSPKFKAELLEDDGATINQAYSTPDGVPYADVPYCATSIKNGPGVYTVFAVEKDTGSTGQCFTLKHTKQYKTPVGWTFACVGKQLADVTQSDIKTSVMGGGFPVVNDPNANPLTLCVNDVTCAGKPTVILNGFVQ
jgi:hypothetical protein